VMCWRHTSVLKPGGVVTVAQVIADLRPLVDYHPLPRSLSFVVSLPRFDSDKPIAGIFWRRVSGWRGSSGMMIDQSAAIPLRPTFPVGMNEVALDETENTNAVALALAHKGAPHLTLVWTRRQTAGRGRDGRSWISTDGNVFWSVLLRPQLDWPDVSELAYVAGLAVHAAVRPHLDLRKAVTLKWPNDVLIDGAKVSGTLIEVRNLVRRPDSSVLTADAVVIGTGINVASHPVDGMMYRTTSLRAEGSAVDRDHLLGDLTSALIGVLEIWLTHGFERIRSLWLDRVFGLGKRITVRISHRPEDQLSGIFESVDYGGCIQLRLDDGQLKAVSAGDVFFREAP
jgi:BirA family transcriptional regulator, biotin operon repressor / biotin---[acetyl-CoA-carboxylase] ligase